MPDNPLGFVHPGFGDIPVASVIAFAGGLGQPEPATASPPDSDAPDVAHATNHLEAWGWMLCDGRSLQVWQYRELFAAIGYLYGGSGDTFVIPDYRGTFLRGTDLGAKADPDTDKRTSASGGSSAYDNVGSRQACAVQNHAHDIPVQTTPSQGSTAQGFLTGSQMTAQTGLIADKPAVGVSAAETRPANIAVNFIIKFTCGLAPFSG